MPIPVRPTLIALALAAGLAACGEREEPVMFIDNPPAGPAGSATAALGGRTYRLEASLWRDFMPGPDVGANGRPLITVARISAVDGSAIPATVRADTIWVIGGSAAYRMPAVEEQPRGAGAATFEVVARNGPNLSPGTTVGVAVRLRDADGGSVVLRVAAPINRTD